MSKSDNQHPTVVVVGASRGIGRDVAERLLRAHPKHGEVVATMRQPDASRLPQEAQIDHLDMNDEDTIKECASHFKSVGTLIVNAAMGDDEKLTQMDTKRMQEYLDTNVMGLHRVICHFLPLLRNGKDKNIVIMSSSSASFKKNTTQPKGLCGPYAVTKAAGNMYGIQLHHELKDEGFAVLCVHPGLTDTRMGQKSGGGGQPIEESAEGAVQLVENIKSYGSPAFINFKGENMEW